MKPRKSRGQATVEYIFLLAFAMYLGKFAVTQFRDFFSKEMGKIGHVLSTHLVVGVCPRNCFFDSYKNGYK